MFKTNAERYQRALNYIYAINAGLADDIRAKIGVGKGGIVGGLLSMDKSSYGYKGASTVGQREAVRALMLCQLAYFSPPHAPHLYVTSAALNTTRTRMLGKQESDIQKEIRLFLKKADPSLEGMALAATHVRALNGYVDGMTRTRKDTNVTLNPVCYHGVVSWLFAAGFVSRRWLAKEGNSLNAYSANNFLGDGTVVDSDKLDSVPRGYIWNIHRVNDKSTCHWGVSLGNGIAAACNNTDESPFAKLKYQDGNTFYGVFELDEICSILNKTDKYGYKKGNDDNIVLRQINPLLQNQYY